MHDPHTAADAAFNLGVALQSRQRFEEARSAYERALALQPTRADAANNLATVYQALGRLDAATRAFRHALTLRPDYADAAFNLGVVLHHQGRLDEAEAAYRRALALEPKHPDAANNLGIALQARGRLGEAEASYRRALALRPDDADAANNLGMALQAQGRLDEAMAAYDRALALRPDLSAVHSNALYCRQYQPGVTLASLAEAHACWERQHAAPLRAAWRPFANSRDPERPLRLGFVSADFRLHAVGFLLIRALEALHRHGCATVCYSDREEADELAVRFRAAAGVWRPTGRLSDEALAEQVRADGIDILFDLAGHMAGNRLLVFARRPAPVQVTWAGYVGTTGLAAIDYLIADRFEVPEGAERYSREAVLRLPDSFICYDPPAYAPAVGPLPALANGHVTFGSLNNPAKITPEVVGVWARVLDRVAGSRLVLKYRGLDDPTTRGRYLGLFAEAGVDLSRVELAGGSSHAELLARYNDLDLALDPFPYSGGLTTCEALWMGVPVITCPGETFAGRHALTYLANVGLTGTVAENLTTYVDLAVAWANDLGRLAAVRAALREQVARSPLCDGDRFARNLLPALRGAWRRWCAGG